MEKVMSFKKMFAVMLLFTFASAVNLFAMDMAEMQRLANARNTVLIDLLSKDKDLKLYKEFFQENVTDQASHYIKNIKDAKVFRLYVPGYFSESLIVTDPALTAILANVTLDLQGFQRFDDRLKKEVKTCENLKLGVRRDIRGTGLGSGLMRYAMHFAHEKGFDGMIAYAKPYDVDPTKKYSDALNKLVSFYENLGGVVEFRDNETATIYFRLNNQ
jgi:GNAT superfamily N-acetyltransferase